MKKHAPGPWLEFGGRIESPNGETVCVMPVWKPELLNAPNARLIAAAPDLLGALEGLMSLYGRTNDEDATDELLAARAAVAKAKGETP